MIIEPLNLTHLLTITAIPILIFACLHFSLRKQNEQTRQRVLLVICVFNAVLYVVYKFAQASETGYDFDIFTNLPLHFCNLNLILLPLAIYTKNKTLLAYQLYFGVPLAWLALVTVYPTFISRPIWNFTPFVYFYYHSALAILPFVLVKLKLFTPSFKVIWQPTVMLIAMTAVIHVVNVVFRATGIAYESNYFFTYGLEGDFFTELLWRIVPYNFFFLIPALLLFAPYVFLITLPFHLSAKKKDKGRLWC